MSYNHHTTLHLGGMYQTRDPRKVLLTDETARRFRRSRHQPALSWYYSCLLHNGLIEERSSCGSCRGSRALDVNASSVLPATHSAVHTAIQSVDLANRFGRMPDTTLWMCTLGGTVPPSQAGMRKIGV